jgi:hypothetical protein
MKTRCYVCVLQILNQLNYCHEMWYKTIVLEATPNPVGLFNFRKVHNNNMTVMRNFHVSFNLTAISSKPFELRV